MDLNILESFHTLNRIVQKAGSCSWYDQSSAFTENNSEASRVSKYLRNRYLFSISMVRTSKSRSDRALNDASSLSLEMDFVLDMIFWKAALIGQPRNNIRLTN